MGGRRTEDDGRGREGGRAKGTPNRIPAAVRSSIARVLDKYVNTDELRVSPEDEMAVTLENDLLAVKPAVRLQMVEKLLSYVTPKLQNTSLEVAQESRRTIEDILDDLSAPKPKE